MYAGHLVTPAVCVCPVQEMHIQLSSATYEHLKGGHFIFERRGTITIKVSQGGGGVGGWPRPIC